MVVLAQEPEVRFCYRLGAWRDLTHYKSAFNALYTTFMYGS